MGYKILYDYLKGNIDVYIYNKDTKFQDYLPSDIEIVMSVHKNDNEDFEIYYSKKCNEFYRVTNCHNIPIYVIYHIDIFEEDKLKEFILKKILHNYLLDNWDERLGLAERI